ncbi:lck-interacting transmembrane adapter 1 [Struthio camelus]|uniref:lck-interacting transmembrane adapter 1 n=1 Tax=Struthio camelus TaxID=8801 RepID=UPI003603BEEA
MAAARGEGLPGPPLLPPAVAPLALLGALVYLGALCAACRRKGRKKKVPPDAVKLVDKSLLRQTTLRSLSKSDTKLHELSRLKPRDEGQRPASMDFFHGPGAGPDSPHCSSVSILPHRELPRIPGPPPLPPAEQTYSNLLFAPPRRPAPDALYECLAAGGEDAPARAPVSSLPAGSADYACVRKVKAAAAAELRDGTTAVPAGHPHRQDNAGHAPRAKVEDMYSTVCKAPGKKWQEAAAPPRAAPPRPEQDAAAALEPCYESIGASARRSPDPDYEAVEADWKKPAKRDESGKPRPAENLYESVGEMWAGEGRRGAGRTAPNGLQVHVTSL